MKKQLFLLSALAIVGTALTSCNGGKTEKLKVGLICLHSPNESTYDKNFVDAFNAAIEKSKEKGYVETSSIRDNVPEGEDCKVVAEQLADDGYNLILTDSFGHDAYLKKAAKDYKDVTFSSATGTQALVIGLSNYHNAFASIYEGRYLAGVAAGEYLLENGHTAEEEIKVGYVGAWPYAEVISGYTSWYLGVRSVMKKATMLVTYTNTWWGYEEEKQAAQQLIAAGCKLISQHADSFGAPDACAEAKIPNVSYNMSTAEKDEKYKGTYIAHSRINWQPYYEEIIEATSTGRKIKGESNQNWTGTLADGSVEIGLSDTLLSAEGKEKVEKAKKALKDGSLKVFNTDTFTVKESASKSTPALVKGTDFDYDKDGHLTMLKADIRDEEPLYVRDTDIVDKENKVVLESYYRSAPAFDIIIDGIDFLK